MYWRKKKAQIWSLLTGLTSELQFAFNLHRRCLWFWLQFSICNFPTQRLRAMHFGCECHLGIPGPKTIAVSQMWVDLHHSRPDSSQNTNAYLQQLVGTWWSRKVLTCTLVHSVSHMQNQFRFWEDQQNAVKCYPHPGSKTQEMSDSSPSPPLLLLHEKQFGRHTSRVQHHTTKGR